MTKKSILPEISQQPIIHVDSSPNVEYPLRILRVYRENCNCKWKGTDDILMKMMNDACDERAVILDKAIEILEEHL